MSVCVCLCTCVSHVYVLLQKKYFRDRPFPKPCSQSFPSLSSICRMNCREDVGTSPEHSQKCLSALLSWSPLSNFNAYLNSLHSFLTSVTILCFRICFLLPSSLSRKIPILQGICSSHIQRI